MTAKAAKWFGKQFPLKQGEALDYEWAGNWATGRLTVWGDDELVENWSKALTAQCAKRGDVQFKTEWKTE